MNSAPELDLPPDGVRKPDAQSMMSAAADWLLLALSLAAIVRAAMLMLR